MTSGSALAVLSLAYRWNITDGIVKAIGKFYRKGVRYGETGKKRTKKNGKKAGKKKCRDTAVGQCQDSG
jgi:hypothetical protein